jgi:serine/threonine protein kinase
MRPPLSGRTVTSRRSNRGGGAPRRRASWLPLPAAARGSIVTPAANRYQVIAPLARGGMGEIVLARRIGPAGFEKLVVLKRPLPSSCTRDFVAALIEEARLLARINHPNVCQIYDLEQAGDQFFLTMEHLEGLSMWSMLGGASSAARDIAPGAVCGLFEQACDGLDALHTLRLPDGGCVVHRDVSPGNLFVTERGVVKVLDLGIAKSSVAADQTPVRQVTGKLSYMSPEQAAGLPLDPRSDLFSLGLVLYDVLHGRPPARARVRARAADAIDFTAMPRPLGDVVRRAVAKQPADRFATAQEMRAALHDAGSSLGGSWIPRELRAWLAECYGPELARRRAIVENGPATRTQILDLRSVFAGQIGELDQAGRMFDAEQAQVGSNPELARIPTKNERRSAALSSRNLIGTAENARFEPVRDQDRIHLAEQASQGAHPTESPTAAHQRSDATAADEPIDRPATRRRRTWVIAGVAAVAVGLSGRALIPRRHGSAAAAPRAATGSATAPPVAIAPAITVATDAPPVATAPVVTAPTTAAPIAAAPIEASPPTSRVPSARVTAAQPPAVAASKPPRALTRPRPSQRPGEPPNPGRLTIDSWPFAVIWIGGSELGTTPLWRIPLPPGQYELHAVAADGRQQALGLRIEPGRERKLTLSWSHP